MAVGETFELVLQGRIHGQVTLNRFHYLQVAGTGGLAELLTAFNTGPAAAIRASQSDEMNHEFIIGNRVLPLPRQSQVIQVVNVTGSVASESLPAADAVVFTKNTANAGHSWRGRWYFSGVPEAHQNLSVLNATGTGSWATMAPFLLGVVNDGGGSSWEPRLKRRNPVLQGGFEYVPLTQVILRTILRTQRRRQIGVGI